jgi:hypothetical protein
MSPPGPIIMTCQSHGVIILGVTVVFILAKFFHLVAQKKGAVGPTRDFWSQIFYISRGEKRSKWPDLD